MAEPGSIAVAAVPSALAIVPAALIPGVDLHAVIGAWAGALFFVLWAPSLVWWQRVGYLFVSWVGGYYAAGELVGRGVLAFSGLPALVCGAGLVTFLISISEWVQGGGMPGWIRAVLAFARHVLSLNGSGGKNG